MSTDPSAANENPSAQASADPSSTVENEIPAEGEQTAPPVDPLTALQLELEAAKALAQAHHDALLRAKAETENVRRRASEDLAKAQKFSIESFAESLVPVRDSLEAALAQENQTAEALLAGVDTTLKQLTAAFERHKLIDVAPQPGDKFDPHVHQAISSLPHETLDANTVITTLQKGYLISGRVLRPALVTVVAAK